MTSASEHLPYYASPQEFLTRERLAELRHEYYQGAVRQFPRTPIWHSRVVAHLGGAINTALRDTEHGLVLMSNMRVASPDCAFMTYPDVVALVTRPALLDDEDDVLLNPALVAEVASGVTRAYDLDEKVARYALLPSVRHYLVVDSEKSFARLCSRPDDCSPWRITETTDPTTVLPLPALGIYLSLADVYDDLDFDEVRNYLAQLTAAP